MYLIRSVATGRVYVGASGDVPRRIREHNAGKVPSTRRDRPWTLLEVEPHADKYTALRREKYLKSGAGRAEIRHRFGWNWQSP